MKQQAAFGFMPPAPGGAGRVREPESYYDDKEAARPLAIVLRDLIDVKHETACHLLDAYGHDLKRLVDASVEELVTFKGITYPKARAIKAAFEFGRRWMARYDVDPHEYKPFTCAEDVAKFYWPRFAGKKQEEFHVLLLNVKGKIIRDVQVALGQLDAAMVHPREVFAPAIRERANAIIVCHNHPSGEPTPSASDVQITQKLAQAGEIIGIRLLDHVVVGDGGRFVSIKDNPGF